MIAQAPGDSIWMQYGGLGLAGLLIVVGIPWLLKHLQSVNVAHAGTIKETNASHSAIIAVMIGDQKEERKAHQECIAKVCETFKNEMKEEREACERRVAQYLQRKQTS